MYVAAALNGQLISEQAARYALQHAASLDMPLVLLHLKNEKDDLSRVRQSYEELKADGEEIGVSVVLEEGEGELETFLKKAEEDYRIHIIFCSTRAQKRYFEESFSEEILGFDLEMKVAIVKIASGTDIDSMRTIATYAHDSDLGPDLFALTASFCKYHLSDLIIATDVSFSEKKLASMAIAKRLKLIRRSDEKLYPYLDMCRMIGVSTRIKHVLEDQVRTDLMPFLISRRVKLLVLEKSQLAFWWRLKKTLAIGAQHEVEELFKNVPINCILLAKS